MCAGSSPLSVAPHSLRRYGGHDICLMRQRLAPLHCQAFSPVPCLGTQAHASCHQQALAISALQGKFFSALDTDFSAPAFWRCSHLSRGLILWKLPGVSEGSSFWIKPFLEKGLGEWSFLPAHRAQGSHVPGSHN